eukprot:scaffold85314_cov30-Tisochrysis_lutea.AAC.3
MRQGEVVLPSSGGYGMACSLQAKRTIRDPARLPAKQLSLRYVTARRRPWATSQGLGLSESGLRGRGVADSVRCARVSQLGSQVGT